MNPSSSSGMTRRTALAAIGTSAIGIAMGLPRPDDDAEYDSLRKLLPAFTEDSLKLLQNLRKDPAYAGYIPAADAQVLARNEKLSIDALMVKLLPLAQSYSHAPISNFYVGVVVRGTTGNLYTGANLEIPGQCLGFTVHAEQAALANAYMHGDPVQALAVGGAPCGHCRQFINEMSPDGEILILTPDKPPAKLSTLLPSAFGPLALGRKAGAFPVAESSFALLRPTTDELARAALDAARRSYAPYSKSPSGVAIRTNAGRIHRGSYIENVAFNPSLSPLQTALVGLIASGQTYSAITEVSLVELDGARITQSAVTEISLRAIAPKATFNRMLANI